MSEELGPGSRMGKTARQPEFIPHELELRAPGRPSMSLALTEKNLELVPVHSFPSRRAQGKTPAWIYVAAALTVLAGILMLTMLVLILTAASP